MNNNIEKGIIGEEIACKYLMSKNYIILERNYRNKIGEIDIIAKSGELIVFVEVKTRTSTNYGYAYEAVNKKKQTKIINTALCYIKQYNLKNFQFRFDIIEIYLGKENKINHFEDAFV